MPASTDTSVAAHSKRPDSSTGRPLADPRNLAAAGTAVLRAIALEALKIVPIIGPYISVGTKAFLEKLDKITAVGLDSKDVLQWIATLSPADYEKLI